MNTLFVLHEGDIVNNDVETQWDNADTSLRLLDGYVPWSVLPGNHDGTDVGGPSENLDNYNSHFSYTRFSSEAWYGGAYNDINTNSYSLFTGGDDDYIIFSFQYHPSDDVLDWANTVIMTYGDRRAIVVTHDYLDTDGTRTDEGDHIWNDFVSIHADQIFLVLCGHMHGEAMRQDIVDGHVVYQVLADYQSRNNGGDGWLRILEFNPAEDTILVKTFSPYLGTWETDSDSQFILSYDMSERATFTPELGVSAEDYRWMDVADQLYSSGFQDSYTYAQADVHISYSAYGGVLTGTLVAQNLKPNFAYQLKLVGTPGTPENELIGYAGRWWQEEWDGAAWVNGGNLNNKGDGSSPNPNDNDYDARKDIIDPTSPTGLHYRYTGYLMCDYFITDSNGDATLYFETGSSYHVLWKEGQSGNYRQVDDGPLKIVTFDPTISTAYDVDYSESTVSIFGEWERLPMGSVNLAAGNYECQMVLTEESFHGTGLLEGNWAAAMAADVSFNITA